MRLALAMIVKNSDEESRLLQRCLDSMDKYVDGIFITITSKKGEKISDALEIVCARFGAKISYFDWKDDFAAARTFNFAQVPKDFDWIIWSDADDVWRGMDKLKPTMEKYPHVDAFGIWYYYDWDEWKKPIVVHRKTMIVKNDGACKWVGALHEDLMPMRQLDVELLMGIDRLHLSSPDRMKKNAERNVKIALKQTKELPDDPRTWWNLANSQLGVADWVNAEQSFKEFMKSSRSKEEIYLAHIRLADVYKAMDKRELAIQELQTGIGIKPMLPDAYYTLGYFYYVFGDMENAESYVLQGTRKLPQIMDLIVFNPRDYDYNPLMLLAKIYFEKNRPDLMVPILKGCLKIYPEDKRLKKLVKDGEKDMKMLERALLTVQRLQGIKDKDRLREELALIPPELQSHPALAVIRNVNFVKQTSSGKDIAIYCGNTVHQWNPELFKTQGFGGSEEAIIHLAREWAKLGWHVTVYNNCGHKQIEFAVDCGLSEPYEANNGTMQRRTIYNDVTYKPFWEFNYRDKQDVVILWRWAKPLDAEINADKVFIDLHDVIGEGEFTEKRLKKLTKIMVKSKFQREFLEKIPDNKICVIPNGLEMNLDPDIKRDPYLIINTSSPDRCMDVLPQLFKEVKKKVPKARLQWAYGWDGFTGSNAHDLKKIAWRDETKKAMKESGIEDLGRLPQAEVGKLYQKASVYAYPTEFAEIDCISIKKAQAAGCFVVGTDFGAVGENLHQGVKIHSKKDKNNWNKPYQFHFGLEGEKEQKSWIDACVKTLQSKAKGSAIEFPTWEQTAKKWCEQFI